MLIIADRHIPYLAGIAEKYGNVKYLAGSEFTHDNIKYADVLIVRTVTRIDRELLENTDVKLVCSATIGFDHIDTEYCVSNGIAWRNAPGCNSKAVQQYIAAALITFSQKRGWNLQGKTIGIVGVGNVGLAVSAVCRAMGMRVLHNDPPRVERENIDGFVDIDVIRDEADFISFHTPLTKEGKYKTQHIGNKDFFSSLKKKPVIINTSRGDVIDTKAIKDALHANMISGAITDCWENEPNIDLEYMGMADIATPHIAGYSSDGKANASRMSLAHIAKFFHLDSSPIAEIHEESPLQAIIDLDRFDSDNRLLETILKTYNPLHDHGLLINSPQSFKQLRDNYEYRREFRGYTITNAKPKEVKLFKDLGFAVD